MSLFSSKLSTTYEQPIHVTSVAPYSNTTRRLHRAERTRPGLHLHPWSRAITSSARWCAGTRLSMSGRTTRLTPSPTFAPPGRTSGGAMATDHDGTLDCTSPGRPAARQASAQQPSSLHCKSAVFELDGTLARLQVCSSESRPATPPPIIAAFSLAPAAYLGISIRLELRCGAVQCSAILPLVQEIERGEIGTWEAGSEFIR